MFETGKEILKTRNHNRLREMKNMKHFKFSIYLRGMIFCRKLFQGKSLTTILSAFFQFFFVLIIFLTPFPYFFLDSN